MPGSYTWKALVSDFFCHLLKKIYFQLEKMLAVETFGGTLVAMINIDLSNFTAADAG